MTFGHGDLGCISVNGSRGGINQSTDLVINTGFQDVEGTFDINVEGSSREILTMKEPHGRQMNDAIHALHGVVKQVKVPTVPAG